MLKKHMAACLVATAFAVAPAAAQTPPAPPSGGTDRPAASGTGTTTSGSSAMQPGAGGAAQPTAPATPPTMAQSGGSQGSGQFMTQMQPTQMSASRLIGTTVVSTNNESIGDVNDVVLDRSGQTVGVVIGVGGFLGIGEKDVAVPFQALDFNASAQQSAANNTAGTTTGSAPATTGSTGASNTSTATTGNTGNAGTGAGASGANNDGGVPDRVVLKMTKAELQAAPAFQRSSGGNAGGAGGTSTNRP